MRSSVPHNRLSGIPRNRRRETFSLVSLLILLVVTAGRNCSAQKHETVRLLAVGDILLASSVERLMKERGQEYPFVAMKPLFRKADIVFGNLECCVAFSGSPIPKQYNFRARPGREKVLRNAGFSIVSLANNHAWDFGRDALQETVQRVKKAGVHTVGAGKERREAHRLVVLRRKGLKIGFLAYMGLLPPLLPESATQPCLAVGEEKIIRQEVKRAKRQVNVLIVSLHAGVEMAPQPNFRQKQFAHAAIDSGADLILGHHPHVKQPLVFYRGKPIAYSLGNFVFSYGGRGTGAMLEASLSAKGVEKVTLHPLTLHNGQPRPIR